MMVRKTVFVLLISACTLWAQAPKSKSAPASQSSASKFAAQGGTATSQAKPAAKPAAPAAKPQAPAAAAKAKPAAAAKPAVKKAAKPEMAGAKKAPASKRDPFVSPVVARGAGPGTGCATGKRCLVIDQVTLRGVVKSASGMIAVVVNPANKAYFLRENDPVFNGYVVKITGDSVIFKENVMDNLGRTTTREVVKKVSAPAA